MQNIQIIGRLTDDAAVKSVTRQGVRSEFIVFSVACNESRDDEKNTTFYNVTMPKNGILEWLKKGQQVSILGRFRFNISQDDSGKSYPHLNISVLDIQLLGGKKKDASGNEKQGETFPAVRTDIPKL